MDKKVVILVILFCSVVLAGGVFLATAPAPPKITGLDDFAKCLTQKGTVMYGSAGCSYCQQTKNNFGDSFQYVTYVECSRDPQTCLDKGIDGYPTWILGDGAVLPGMRPLAELSEKTSCPLPR